MRFITIAAIILTFRALDLGTTWLASPDLSREINPLYRAMGWRKAILWNLLCALFAVDVHATVFVCVASFMCSMWNISVWRSSRPAPQPEDPLAGTRCGRCGFAYETFKKQGQSVTQVGQRAFFCHYCYNHLTTNK